MHAPLPRFNAFMGKLSTRGYGQLRDFPGILAPGLFQKRDLNINKQLKNLTNSEVKTVKNVLHTADII